VNKYYFVSILRDARAEPLPEREVTHAWDMDGVAANFPDINFVTFHVGLPFIDVICW